ncbi:hypothetical protein GCM10010211_25300 [Streptomyces albospinus]|uniref:Uncharacterized protein n=1 Tax=Streptomyces albospinus TaxID=285515 RepID=A0ABQ2UZ80_9ACTN|nr:hypothetical protein GCM10010211_25300 [Streptomyces albospinus]
MPAGTYLGNLAGRRTTCAVMGALSLGALSGGMIVDRTSPSTVMVLGGATAALVVPAAWPHFAKRREWPRS